MPVSSTTTAAPITKTTTPHYHVYSSTSPIPRTTARATTAAPHRLHRKVPPSPKADFFHGKTDDEEEECGKCKVQKKSNIYITK